MGFADTMDPATQGGSNVNWRPDPQAQHISQLLGWKDLGLKKIKADDSHFGDRFGRTVILHGNHLIVGADYATCQDPASSPGGVCQAPGKGAVYVYEMDYVTAPYYRWDGTTVHGGGAATWGGYPTSSSSATVCDADGSNCVLTTGFCTDCTDAASDGLACNSANACPHSGTCRYAPPFTVAGSKYWGQRIRLQPSDLANGDRFGAAIAFDGETNTLVVGAPRASVAARCGVNYILSVREGASGACAQAGAVYVFQKDFGGQNNWGQVAKFTTNPGNHETSGSYCSSGRESPITGNGNCPGANCWICTNIVGNGTTAGTLTLHVVGPVSANTEYRFAFDVENRDMAQAAQIVSIQATAAAGNIAAVEATRPGTILKGVRGGADPLKVVQPSFVSTNLGAATGTVRMTQIGQSNPTAGATNINRRCRPFEGCCPALFCDWTKHTGGWRDKHTHRDHSLQHSLGCQ